MTFSIPTLDREIWRPTEPGTAPPRQRLRALATLVDAGIDASVGMAPILPGLSDRPELLADVVQGRPRRRRDLDLDRTCCTSGPGTREHFLDNLARDWPELLPRYERLYAGRAYLGTARDRAGPPRGRRAPRAFAIADRRRVRLLPVAAQPPEPEQLDLRRRLGGIVAPSAAARRLSGPPAVDGGAARTSRSRRSRPKSPRATIAAGDDEEAGEDREHVVRRRSR